MKRSVFIRRDRAGGVIRAAVALLVIVVCGCSSIRPPSETAATERILLTTGYCKCGVCCDWKRNWYGRAVYASGPMKGQRKHVGITANGTRAKRGVIAADTSRYPFGTIMYVPGYGYGRVEDRGGAIKGEHIDLYFPLHGQALKWGAKKLKVKIWLPPKR